MLPLILKEFKYNIYSWFIPVILTTVAILTFSSGSWFAFHNVLTTEAAQLGLQTVSQEWALRVHQDSTGFAGLLIAVVIWYQVSGMKRTRFQSLVYVRPITTGSIALINMFSVVLTMLIPILAGSILGVLITGFIKGLWPDLSLYVQSTLFNTIPGLITWIIVVGTLSSVSLDLKVLVFPIAIAWMLFMSIPATSLFWFYRGISHPLNPMADPLVWRQLIYDGIVLLVAVLVWVAILQGERSGISWLKNGRSRSKHFQVVSQAWLGQRFYDLKVVLGKKWLGGLVGVTGLALVLAGPFGPMKASIEIQRFFALGFSELLFPLFGLMVAGSVFTMDEHYRVKELLNQRPGGEGQRFRQKFWSLFAYFTAICLYYGFVIHVLKPFIPFSHIVAILLPPMLFLSGLALLAIAITKNQFVGYGVGLLYWLVAYYFERSFPWFLSPFYHLAEYNFVFTRDLLWVNKALLLVLALVLFVLGFWQGFDKTRKQLS